MKKILVAIDGSEASKRALDRALELSKYLGALLVVIHVVPSVEMGRLPSPTSLATVLRENPPTFLPIPPQVAFRLTREALTELEYAKNKAEEIGVKVDFVIPEGDPAKSVIEEARKGYYLLVIGYRRKLRIPGLGSVASRIVNNVEIPVLIVK